MRLLKLAFFSQLLIFPSLLTEAGLINSRSRPDDFGSTDFPLAPYVSHPDIRNYHRFVNQVYSELPTTMQFEVREFMKVMKGGKSKSQYILLALYFNKTAALELIDHALEVGEDINAVPVSETFALEVGEDIAVPVSETLTLLDTLSMNFDYNNLLMTVSDRQVVIEYLLQRGARANNAFRLLFLNFIDQAATVPGEVSAFSGIFNTMQAFLVHDPNLVNRRINRNNDPLRYPLIIAILLKHSYLMQFLLSQSNINLHIREGSVGCVGLFIKFWQEVSDDIKLPILETMLEAGAPVYDRALGSSAGEPMEAAVATFQGSIITMLSRYGATVNYARRYATSPLVHALLSRGEVEEKINIIRTLLDNEAKINELVPHPSAGPAIDRDIVSSSPNATPLYYVMGMPSISYVDRQRLVDFLLENKADPNLRSAGEGFPLHLAITRGYDEIIERLMWGGAKPTLRNDRGQTAFELAEAMDEQLPTPRFRLLLESFVMPRNSLLDYYLRQIGRIVYYVSYGILAVRFQNHCLKFILVVCGLGLYLSGSFLDSWNLSWIWGVNCVVLPLCFFGPIAGLEKRMLEMLVQHPVPTLPSERKAPENRLVSTVRPRPQTASSGKAVRRKLAVTSASSAEEKKPILSLVEACRIGDVAQVKRHIEEQADLSQVENDFTALQAACFYGHAAIVDVLSDEKGKDLAVTRENTQRETALFLAAKKGHWPIVDFLLNHASQWQLEIHPTNPHTETLLQLAVENLKFPLLNKIFQICPVENKGALLLHALSQGVKFSTGEKEFNEFVVAFIAAYPEVINYSNPKKVTPLMMACQAGYFRVVEALITAGVNVHLVDVQGKSALYYAAAAASQLAESNKSRKTFITILNRLAQEGAKPNARWENTDVLPAPDGEAKRVEAFLEKWQLRKSEEEKKALSPWKSVLEEIKSKGQQRQVNEAKQLAKKLQQEKDSIRQQQEQKRNEIRERKKEHKKEQKKEEKAKSSRVKKKAPLPLEEKKQEVDHQSWANLIVDYIVRLGVVFYQEQVDQVEKPEDEKDISADQNAFQAYMQHSLRVYYLHRLLFCLTCYGKHIQRDHKLIDNGGIHNLLTKRGKKSLCLSPSYESYDAVLATTEEIVSELPQNLLKALKKPHELQSGLTTKQRHQIAGLFGLVEKADRNELQPVGQLFIQGTRLYNILFRFHATLTENTGVVKEHFTAVKLFLLPAMGYVFHLLAKKKEAKRDTHEVHLKGSLDYGKVEKHYGNYLDLLVLLFTLCGETRLTNRQPKKIAQFVKRCHFEVRNLIAHEAKVTMSAQFLLELAKEASALVRTKITWSAVMSMPDVALVEEEIEKGFQMVGYSGQFFTAPASRSGSRTEHSAVDIVVSYLRPQFG